MRHARSRGPRTFLILPAAASSWTRSKPLPLIAIGVAGDRLLADFNDGVVFALRVFREFVELTLRFLLRGRDPNENRDRHMWFGFHAPYTGEVFELTSDCLNTPLRNIVPEPFLGDKAVCFAHLCLNTSRRF